MKLSTNGCFRRAVKLAFMGGTVGAAASPILAVAEDVTQLQGVQVTGSLIRRTDTETASPVLTISRAQITQSGAVSLEQLLYTLPSLTGVATNSQVNNGGGGGDATISLRGLDADRTLLLLDGKRIVFQDVNSIPVNMIDHIDVLNEGAGTVYGTDAVAGVVNFITRKNFHGTEIEASYGEASDHKDDIKREFTITHGITGEKGSMVFGASYEKNGSVQALNRATTANQYAIYLGAVKQNASGTIPSGVYTLSQPTPYAGVATAGNTKGKSFNFIDSNGRGCNSVTKAPGASGNTFDPADYECVASLPTNSQTYNFQAQNYASVPSQHISLFTTGKQSFSDNLQGYVSTLFTQNQGRLQLAPEPFISNGNVDASGNVIPITYSAASQYNPFGQDISAFKFRAVDAGDRATTFDNVQIQATIGLKATIFERFEWDNSFTYGREDTTQTNYGGFNLTDINNKLGPSKNGVCYTDATYTTTVPGCTPIDLVGTAGTGYGGLSSVVQDHLISNLKAFDSNINGELFMLPAGPLSVAVGGEFRLLSLSDNPDGLQQTFEITDYSGAATKGSYDSREAYIEVLAPILKDVPGIGSLSLDVGERYSHYSNFKDNEAEKFALEYKPVKDLLIRATYAQIFRAPTIADLYAGPAASAPSYTDPCAGYTGQANLAEVCKGVPSNGSFTGKAVNTQASVVSGGNPNLGPEKGYTIDYGAVFSPDFYKPLSITGDFYIYNIRNAIQSLTLQEELNACAAGNSSVCGSFFRGPDGNVEGGTQAPQNAGTLFTDGFDFNVRLNYPRTPFGAFQFNMNGTYLDKYEQTIKGVSHYSLAGEDAGPQYLTGGSYPRLKFISTLDWSFRSVEVVLRNRFVASIVDNGGQDGNGNVQGVDIGGPVGQIGYVGNKANYESYGVTGAGQCSIGGPATAQAVDVNGAFSAPGTVLSYTCSRKSGYVDYQDISITYKVKSIKTDFTIGVYDIFDQGAPILYTYGPNFNYDPSNYDNTGRYIYGKIRVLF